MHCGAEVTESSTNKQHHLSKREEHSAEEMAAMETEFRSMIGSLAFASVTIRWDIAYSVSVLWRYLMKPNRKVIAAARRVI